MNFQLDKAEAGVVLNALNQSQGNCMATGLSDRVDALHAQVSGKPGEGITQLRLDESHCYALLNVLNWYNDVPAAEATILAQLQERTEQLMGELQDQIDWYERRDELEEGMIFRCADGDLVKLDRRVPGDGTRWYVADWSGYWRYEDGTIEPGDLVEEINDPAQEPDTPTM